MHDSFTPLLVRESTGHDSFLPSANSRASARSHVVNQMEMVPLAFHRYLWLGERDNIDILEGSLQQDLSTFTS